MSTPKIIQEEHLQASDKQQDEDLYIKMKRINNNVNTLEQLPMNKYETRINPKHLQRRRSGSRHKHRKLTVDKVKKEAEKILEEFLQNQLNKQSVQTRSPEKHYERYLELDVTEGTTPSGSSTGYLASSSNFLREDSIPYADASEEELRKAESLPHDEFIVLKDSSGPSHSRGLAIIHGKSKSAPYPQKYDLDLQKDNQWKYAPPPPAPPGTPRYPSEETSSGMSSSVPYVGQHAGSSSIPCSSESLDVKGKSQHEIIPNKVSAKVPSTLDLPTSSMHSKSPKSSSASTTLSDRANSPRKQIPSFLTVRKFKHSSSTSSDTSDNEGHYKIKGRKKKTMFKKAQERLSIMLRLNKHKSAPPDDEYYYNSEPPRKKKPPKKTKKDRRKEKENMPVMDEADVLEERHTHIDKHIHQSREKGFGRFIHRTEDTTTTVDMVSDGENKHMEAHVRVKQMSDDKTGFLGKLRRMTGFSMDPGSPKSAVKESRSAHTIRPATQPSYIRGESVPGGYRVASVDRATYHDHNHVNAVEVISTNDLRRHSSHIDIVDHDGSMLNRLYFEADCLPRNKSFDYHEETDITERHVSEGNHVRVVRDVSTHDHIEERLDMDGGGERELSKDETEDLYNKVAGRLAEIGDNWVTEKELEQSRRSSSSSPRSKLSLKSGDEPASQSEEAIKKDELSLLEAEIRDELRIVADNVDARLAANARAAALHIAGIATYQKFKDTVQDSVGNEVGWAQVAAVFHLTKRAMQLAGGSGALAMQIRDNSLKYISDKFAQWIVDQGGWDSLVSDGSSSSSDTDLD